MWIVERPDEGKFVVLSRRLLVKRTLAWLGWHRRVSKDYQALPESSETFILIATIYLMLHRLAPG